jgi:hypothetical protein
MAQAAGVPEARVATAVTVVDGFGVKAARRQNRADQEVRDGLAAVAEVLDAGARLLERAPGVRTAETSVVC